MEPTKRGWVYKWREGREDESFVLVLSPDYRGNERFVNILRFGSAPRGRDLVEIHNKLLGETNCLHVGMVTYAQREEIAEKPLFQLSERQIARINKQLCIQLGISNEETIIELQFYQKKCNELIQQYGNVEFEL